MAEALELSTEEMERAAHNILSASQEFSVPENEEDLLVGHHAPIQRSASSGPGDARHVLVNRRSDHKPPL